LLGCRTGNPFGSIRDLITWTLHSHRQGRHK